MSNYNSNYEIAQEISARIGTAPVPFESVYSTALEIYNELGGEPTQFDDVYSILLNTLPLVEGGIASKVIDDNVITTVKTWSSSKINSELSGKQNTLTAGEGIEISGNTISATPFTAEQQAAIDSTITANKVATYDGYGTKITTLQTDKLDKNYTANKIYGTDSLGAQTVYTLGDGLAFDNGQIINTRTSADWGNITGTLSNQTDLQNALDSKQNTLTAGAGIDISGNTISATPTDNATNDDIDFMFAREIKLIREQKINENYIDWLVNTKGETIEYNGQRYYKWVMWGNDRNEGSGPAKANPNWCVLTNTLNVQLPFNDVSPEFEYMVYIEGESIWPQDYTHGNYTKITFQL